MEYLFHGTESGKLPTLNRAVFKKTKAAAKQSAVSLCTDFCPCFTQYSCGWDNLGKQSWGISWPPNQEPVVITLLKKLGINNGHESWC